MGTEATVGGARKIAFVTSLTEISTKDLEGVGTVRTDQYGAHYRWVLNNSTDAGRVGQPACFDASAVAATFMQNVITEDISASDEWFMAGLFISAIPGSGYGWILAWGKYDTARLDVTAASAGDLLIPTVETDTAATALSSGRAYCFNAVIPVAGIYGTGAGTAYEANWAANPHAILLDAIVTGAGTASTAALAASVFVKGMI